MILPSLSPTPTLETDRLLMRAPMLQDMDPFLAFLNSERGVWVGGGPNEAPGKAWRIAAMLMGHWQIHGFGTFICVEKSSARPVARIGPFHPGDWPERELGWSVWHPDDEGKGVASEAAREVIRHCYEDLGWDTLVSYIDAANPRSIALAERLGATRDATAARPDRADLVYRHPRPVRR